MEELFNKDLIAFQVIDNDNEIECNEALLFENENEVNLFFTNPEKVIKVLELEIDEERGEMIDSFISIFANGKTINSVKINLQYCGEKWIKRMSKGVIIKK